MPVRKPPTTRKNPRKDATSKPAHGELKRHKPPSRPVGRPILIEIFRRFREANPEPKGELEHVDPYTLLVAVVLSAQATDAGVISSPAATFAQSTPGSRVDPSPTVAKYDMNARRS